MRCDMFLFGISEKAGWFYTPTFHVYQRVNQDVYVYVSKYIGFYVLQLYKRGTTGLCSLEVRSEENIKGLFELGETWLERYQEWDEELISKDPHYIGQQDWRKNCWIS